MNPQILERFLSGNATDEEMLQCEEYLASEGGQLAAAAAEDDSLLRSLRSPDDVTAVTQETAEIVERMQKWADGPPLSGKDIERILAPAEKSDELGRIDHYRILEYMASGGMGLVFKAEDTQLQRLVCIKVMHPRLGGDNDARRRFEQETRAAARMHSERIVTILDVGRHRDLPYLVMQLLEGESLRGRLKRDERLPAAEALRIAIHVAEGLQYAHAQGLFHRDIKPDNIWITTEGDVKLLDFGLAHIVDSSANLTTTGNVLGTPRYMSPEQVRGEEIDCRSDLFSLGVVLLEMLTGRSPFERETLYAMLIAVGQDEADMDEAPELLRPILTQLLAKSADDRLPDANALIERLSAASADIVSAPTPQLRRSPRRRRLTTVLTGCVLAACMMGVGALITVVTDRGTLVVKAAPGVSVTITDGSVRIVDPKTNREFKVGIGDRRLPTGVYQLTLTDSKSKYQLSSKVIGIRRGETEIVSVELIDKTQPDSTDPPQVGANPVGVDPSEALDQLMASIALSPERKQGLRDKLLQSITLAEQSRQEPHLDLDSLSSIDPAQPLEFTPGGPLTASATVRQPEPLSVGNWSIEPAVHVGKILSADIAPDGRWVATGDAKGMIRVWDGRTLRLRAIVPCGDAVRQIRWSPQQNVFAAIVSGSYSQRVLIWRITEAGVELLGHRQQDAEAVAWSPDARRLAIQTDSVQFFDVASKLTAAVPNAGISGAISDRPWSRDGQYFSARVDGEIHVWDLWNEKLFHKFTGDATSQCVSGRWGVDTNQILVRRQQDDGQQLIQMWSIPGLVNERVPFPEGASQYAWNPSTKTLARIEERRLVISTTEGEWKGESEGEWEGVIPSDLGRNFQLRWSSSKGDQLLVYSSHSVNVCQRSSAPDSGWEIREILACHLPAPISATEISAAGSHALLPLYLQDKEKGAYSFEANLFDLESLSVKWSRALPVAPQSASSYASSSVTLSPDGRRLALVTSSYSEHEHDPANPGRRLPTTRIYSADVEVIDAVSGETQFDKTLQDVFEMQWSSNGRYLFGTSAAGRSVFGGRRAPPVIWDSVKQGLLEIEPLEQRHSSGRPLDRTMLPYGLFESSPLFLTAIDRPGTRDTSILQLLDLTSKENKLMGEYPCRDPLMTVQGDRAWVTGSQGAEYLIDISGEEPIVKELERQQSLRGSVPARMTLALSASGKYGSRYRIETRLNRPPNERNSAPSYSIRLNIFSFDEEQGGPHAKQVESSNAPRQWHTPQWHKTRPVLAWLQADQTIWYDMETGSEARTKFMGDRWRSLLSMDWGWLAIDTESTMLALDHHGHPLGRLYHWAPRGDAKGEPRRLPNQWITARGGWNGEANHPGLRAVTFEDGRLVTRASDHLAAKLSDGGPRQIKLQP